MCNFESAKLHLDCPKCFSDNVDRISKIYRNGYGLFAKVRCLDCLKTSEVGDGEYFIKDDEEPEKKETDSNVEAIHCPLCSTENIKVEMEYRTIYDTHAWICPECPNITFEFIFFKNIDDLKLLVD